jgi:hypothetical protein
MNARRHLETGTARCGVSSHLAAFCLGLAVTIGGGHACAESTRVEANGTPAIAGAHLDFKIVIPIVLRLNTSLGTLFTNARRAETIVVSTLEAGLHSTIASRSDAGSIRATMETVVRAAGRSQVGYTVSMP